MYYPDEMTLSSSRSGTAAPALARLSAVRISKSDDAG